jgi:protease-4
VTGGIGVIFNAYNLEDFLAQLSITGVQVKSGQHIDLGSPLRRIPDEGRELLQSIADDFKQRFHERIREGRGLPLDQDEDFLDGRILTAPQALDAGLIDSIGYLDDAIAVAGQQAGNVKTQPVLLHRCRDRGETPYAITPNNPITNEILPLDVPGLSRAELPTFLYLWQPNPSYAN